MEIWGHRRRWYLEKIIAYRYYLGRGDFFFSEIEGLLSTGGLGGILILIVEKYSNYLFPWQLAILLVLCFRALKVCLGIIDKKYIKSGQTEAEWGVRKGLNSWATEQMNMTREMHKALCPDSKIKHEGFVSEK